MQTEVRSFRRVCFAVGASVVLAACGGKGAGPDVSAATCGQPEDGSRLKAFYLVGDDGSREYFDIWYDTQLAAYCRFQVTTDGRTRCVPFDRSFGASFADGACRQGMVDDYPSACLRRAHGVPKYAMQIETLDECSENFRLFSLGAGFAPASFYLKGADGSCPATAIPNPDSLIFYLLGDEVLLTSLVAADVQSQGARLLTQYATGEDGSRGRVHRFVDRANMFDSLQGVDCDMQVAADGLVRCLPASSRNVLRSGGFGDAQCSQRIAIDDRFACERTAVAAPKWAAVLEDAAPSADACASPPRVHPARLGAPSVPAMTYVPLQDNTISACQAVANTEGLPVYALAEEIPASSFVPVTLRDQTCGPNRTRGTRLAVKYDTSEDGLRIERGFWHDTNLDVTCAFRIAADGKLRCVPEEQASFGDFFSDAACTQAVASADPCPGEAPDPSGATFAVGVADPTDPGSDPCFFDGDDGRARVYRLGARVTLQVAYSRISDGSCIGTAVSELTPIPFFYEVASEVPPSELVAGAYRAP